MTSPFWTRSTLSPVRHTAVLVTLVGLAGLAVSAQSRRIEPAEVRCPSVLGIGVNTDLAFCDVVIHREADRGVVVVLPARCGEATLSFNLHNRHTYSEDETREGRAYTQYLATVAIATMEGAILGRGVVLTEFRTESDLVDRVTGGAGPVGVKAIAPTGRERVSVTVPDDIEQVSIVGLTLEVQRVQERDTVDTPGSPVAVLSDVQIEYRPR